MEPAPVRLAPMVARAEVRLRVAVQRWVAAPLRVAVQRWVAVQLRVAQLRAVAWPRRAVAGRAETPRRLGPKLEPRRASKEARPNPRAKRHSDKPCGEG
jgi:hypothetical protein